MSSGHGEQRCRIGDFARQAVARSEQLRDELARAQEFARQLAAHAPRSAR